MSKHAETPPTTTTDSGVSDRTLLKRFVEDRDDEAFATIVARYAKLVMGVCTRNLDDFQDAEDAFQATFLVLARKATVVRWKSSLTSWVFRVALNITKNARRRRAKRNEVELAWIPIGPDHLNKSLQKMPLSPRFLKKWYRVIVNTEAIFLHVRSIRPKSGTPGIAFSSVNTRFFGWMVIV